MNQQSDRLAGLRRALACSAALALPLVFGSLATTVLPAPAAYAAEGGNKLVEDATKKLRARDIAGAMRSAQAAREAEPDNVDANLVYQRVAVRVLGEAAVLDEYVQFAAEKPDDPFRAYLAARMLDPTKAVAQFETLAPKFRGSPWMQVGRGEALSKLARFSEANAAYDKAIEAAPSEIRFVRYKARALEGSERWSEATNAWRRVLAKMPKDRDAHLGLGDCLRRQGDLAEARAEFQQLAQADPKDLEPRYRLALCDFDAGDLDKAIASVEVLLKFDKNMVDALCLGAEAELRKVLKEVDKTGATATDKDLEGAFKYANRAAAVDPENPQAHFVLGAVNEAAGEGDADILESALEEYDLMLELLPFPGPERVRGLIAKAFVQLRLARWESAQATAQRALDIQPDNLTAVLHAAHAMTAGGDPEGALKTHYKHALKLDKNDPRVQYGVGTAHWAMKKTSKAKKFLAKAVKLDDSNGAYRLAYGELLYELGDFKKAWNELFEATDLRPKDRHSWAAYGRALTADDYWEDAIEAYKQVVELDAETVQEHLYLAILYDRVDEIELAQKHAQKWQEMGGRDSNLGSWIEDLLSLDLEGEEEGDDE